MNIKVCSWQYDGGAIFYSEGVGRHPELPPSAPMQVFKRLNLVGRFGVTTGRSYCGVGGLSVKGTGAPSMSQDERSSANVMLRSVAVQSGWNTPYPGSQKSRF